MIFLCIDSPKLFDGWVINIFDDAIPFFRISQQNARTTEQVLDRLVNITFVNADLENALRIIARQMDLNIIIGPGVRGRTITLDLRDVPLRFALDSILSANDLGFIIERGGIVRVVPIELIRPDAIERQTKGLCNRSSALSANPVVPT